MQTVIVGAIIIQKAKKEKNVKRRFLLLITLILTLCLTISCLSGCDIFGGKEDTDGDGVIHLYSAFTPNEKKLYTDTVGEVIPFIENSEYYVDTYTLEFDDYYEKGVSFQSIGNSNEEFENYLKAFDSYIMYETERDQHGDTWYYFTTEKGCYIDVCYYLISGDRCVDVYIYIICEYEDNGNTDSDNNQGGNTDNDNQGGSNDGGNDSGNSGNQGGNDSGNSGNVSYAYTDFTSAEKELIRNFLGTLIPFVPTNEYYVEEYYDEYYEMDCLCYYSFGNTEEDFTAFMLSFDGYELVDSYEDEENDTWYCLEKGDVYVEMAYYTYEGDDVIDVYIYYTGDNSGSGDSGSDSGNQGGSNGGSSSGGSSSDYDVITNEGAGLPTGTDGIFNVDFTDATNVKDVTDQGYYLDGCPTVGSPAVLVIPVEFSDATASSKGCQISKIVTAFTGKAGSTDYYSVDEYYYISSYGKLDLDITVLDQWFKPQYSSSYYAELVDSDGYFIGDQVIMDEALAYLEVKMDLSDFDSDGNGIIDAVVLVNTLEVGEDDFHWAYRYWNYYVDDQGYYYEYDGVSANDYLWASYYFLHEGYDEDGEVYYDSSIMNTYTFIHEFGHILGVDDYYDTSNAGNHPLENCDVMDSMVGDHNPYSKFNLGWITTSRLVTTNSSITLTLDSFTETGDSIIIANNWDETLGAYQEYYVIIYYTMTGLNGGDAGYFSRDGIVVYHVNSSLYSEEYEGETYYDVFNTNTDPSDQYGTEDNLIEFVKSAEGNFTYVEGDYMPSVTDDLGNKLGYSFTVDSIGENGATITVTAK